MRVLLNSSNLCEVAYHNQSQIMEITFNSGHIYRYTAVPHVVFQDLINAPSAGRFYNRFIRGRFTSIRWF